MYIEKVKICLPFCVMIVVEFKAYVIFACNVGTLLVHVGET
jgi:hypothetical protein